ncbi:hypothetical protein ASE27_03720 [Oerskovia sp. Root918]|uniref:hypothetical protein n=1 Tax=Oerskovia sp. Root918 TaxID=1736607 RepID=UPI0006F3A09C|nr:hypothetical protein [Oerskovia sp. Root918]KRD47443.1 hypothetical protein ASE27_03720 [Oerskovia sp. Root918]
MLHRALRTVALTAAVTVVLGAALGGATAWSEGAVLVGGARGALVGLIVALVVGVHLSVRTLFARVPESLGPELAAGSVEREVFRLAGVQAFPDAVSVLLLVALLAALAGGDLARWLPVAGLVVVLFDFALRSRVHWARLVAA